MESQLPFRNSIFTRVLFGGIQENFEATPEKEKAADEIIDLLRSSEGPIRVDLVGDQEILLQLSADNNKLRKITKKLPAKTLDIGGEKQDRGIILALARKLRIYPKGLLQSRDKKIYKNRLAYLKEGTPSEIFYNSYKTKGVKGAKWHEFIVGTSFGGNTAYVTIAKE